MAISIPKGTHDIIANEARGYDLIEEVCANVATVYGFDPLRTPVFESTELFNRGVGESSDIVTKEMYTFLDKGKRSITLRPEGTAGIVRSVISNKLHAQADLPLKYYYTGPMFRYERPQLGRFRQFHQFGVESIGVNSIYEDIEVVFLGYEILRNLGFEKITLKINSLGDGPTRSNYKSALQSFFKDKVGHMCPDCKHRYETNPLRILDCKVPEDKLIAEGAPKITQFLSDKAKQDFATVLEKLDGFEIPYEIDDHLVRGLDYYSGLIFEFSYITSEGKDYGALGGGGHYDRLVKELDGPNLEGVGFAFGIERLHAVMSDEGLLNDKIVTDDVHIMSLGDLARGDAIDLGETLRSMGLRVILNYEDKSLKSLFKRAERNGAKVSVIIGEDEVKNEVLQVKNMATEEQTAVSYEEAVNYIADLFKQAHLDHHHDHEDCDCGHDHESTDCECSHDEKETEICACGHSELVDGECECGHHHDHEEKECCGGQNKDKDHECCGGSHEHAKDKECCGGHGHKKE